MIEFQVCIVALPTTSIVTMPTAVVTEPVNSQPENTTKSFEPSDDVVLGDANADGKVDMKDVLLVRKTLAGLANVQSNVNADANKDSCLDMKDVLLIRKFLANLAVL